MQATILFIEDNPDTLQLYQRYLTGTGYRFASAATDAQIASALEEIVPHTIVLDVMLSGMDGWEVLGRLRTHPRTQDVPVVMCSILPLEQLARNLGAAAFLQSRSAGRLCWQRWPANERRGGKSPAQRRDAGQQLRQRQPRPARHGERLADDRLPLRIARR